MHFITTKFPNNPPVLQEMNVHIFIPYFQLINSHPNFCNAHMIMEPAVKARKAVNIANSNLVVKIVCEHIYPFPLGDSE